MLLRRFTDNRPLPTRLQFTVRVTSTVTWSLKVDQDIFQLYHCLLRLFDACSRLLYVHITLTCPTSGCTTYSGYDLTRLMNELVDEVCRLVEP